MITTLVNIGWTHLLENCLDLAEQSTTEALWLLECRQYGRFDVRNLACVEYQLGMIASRRGQTTMALGCWRKALYRQQSSLKSNHRDIAVSMEAIGSAYQQLAEWSTARTFLEGALEIRKEWRDYLVVARIRSRLALVLLELNEVDRAVQILSKASTTCTKFGVPLDEIGREARRRLSTLRQDRLNS